jgi:hypothetical protein
MNSPSSPVRKYGLLRLAVWPVVAVAAGFGIAWSAHLVHGHWHLVWLYGRQTLAGFGLLMLMTPNRRTPRRLR